MLGALSLMLLSFVALVSPFRLSFTSRSLTQGPAHPSSTLAYEEGDSRQDKNHVAIVKDLPQNDPDDEHTWPKVDIHAPSSVASMDSLSLKPPLTKRPESQWGPEPIGTFLFGLIQSVIGVSGLYLMYRFRYRSSQSRHSGEVDQGL